MTTIESLFFSIGIGSTIVFLWNHFFRMIYHGIRVAGTEAVHYIFCKPGDHYYKNFSDWDKLWLIPKFFTYRFIDVFINYWHGYEVEVELWK